MPNASADGSPEMVTSEFPDVNLTASRENLGFSGGNNLILESVRARNIVLLNPDTEAQPGSLATLVRFLDDHPAAGAVGPKLLNSDGSLQRNGRRARIECAGHSLPIPVQLEEHAIACVLVRPPVTAPRALQRMAKLRRGRCRER